MGKVFLDMAVSLDGFISGPKGEDGGLHNWYFSPSGGSAVVIDELLQTTGAMVMGRRAYDAGDRHDGFVDNPYRVPHFVLSHDAPEKAAKGDTSFTFVADGIDSAITQAEAAAGDKDVCVAGGADVAQQYLEAGLLDELRLHLVPVLFGGGRRLFEHLGTERIQLEQTRVLGSPGVTHLVFRIVKEHRHAE